MTNSLRPCPRCGRHSRTDEAVCPFCQAELPLAHHFPVVSFGEPRPAPKYGGPPLHRPATWLGCVLFVSFAVALYLFLWRWHS